MIDKQMQMPGLVFERLWQDKYGAPMRMFEARAALNAPALVEALRACIEAIEEEVHAGDDHPVVKAHGKIAKQARAALAAAEGKK